MLGIDIFNKRRKSGIGAYPVVVIVRTDKRSVKADITRLECGNERKLSAEEILFGNTVLLVKKRECGKLNLVGNVLVIVRKSADKNIEGLT